MSEIIYTNRPDLSFIKNSKVLIILDDNLDERLISDFKLQDYYLYKFCALEENKTLDNVNMIYSYLLENNFNRKDYIVCFGGGITGDLGGYVAATYLRGINYINIPTTLLSQVDSSVGGKVAVNLNGFKNQIGTFYEASKVYINTEYLKTLDKKVFFDAFSEIIKYAFILDFDLYNTLLDKEYVLNNLEDIVKWCIDLKTKVVSQDLYDNDIRQILNYGHTFAHLIEEKYKISHANSVAYGMIMTSYLFDLDNIAEEIKRLCTSYNIDVSLKIELDLNKIKTDKKFNNSSINEVIVEEIGASKILNLSFEEYQKRYEDKWEV